MTDHNERINTSNIRPSSVYNEIENQEGSLEIIDDPLTADEVHVQEIKKPVISPPMSPLAASATVVNLLLATGPFT